MPSPASSHAPISGPLSSKFDYQAASRPLNETRRKHLHGGRGSDDEGETTEEESEDGRQRRMLACKASNMGSGKQNCLGVGGPGSQFWVSKDPDTSGLGNTIVRWDIITATRQAIDEMVQRRIDNGLPVVEKMITNCKSEFVNEISEVNDWAEQLDLGPDSSSYKFEGLARITPTVQISVLVTIVPDEADIEVSAFPCFGRMVIC